MIENLHKSLYLGERYNILKRNLSISEIDDVSLNHWRNSMSIISESSFNEMLDSNDYEISIFSHSVSYNYKQNNLKKMFTEYAEKLPWYLFVTRSFNNINKNKTNYKIKEDINVVLDIFLSEVERELLKFMSSMESSFINNTQNLIEDMLAQLEKHLSDFTRKSIVLEINILREEGKLIGKNSEERYENFIEFMKDVDNLKSFYNKYVVLLRQISMSCLMFLKNIKKIISDIQENYSDLRKSFNLEREKLTNITLGEGDTHNFGKTVCLLVFTNKKIVYKPKNLEINLGFERLFYELNMKYLDIDLKVPKTLNYIDHSYEEYIDYIPCKSEKELKKYYYNYGLLMGIVYFFNGNDIHLENLISHKTTPVIVDLETMIQQPIHERIVGTSDLMIDNLFHRLSRTLLLPTKGLKLEDPVNIELSALSGKFEKNAFSVLQVTDEKKDTIHYDFMPIDFKGSNNLPFDSEKESIDYKLFKKEIKNGFTYISNILLKESKDEYFKKKITNLFGNIEVRVLLRDTNQYATILHHLNHPDLLEDMLDREKALENLWSFPFKNKQIIKSECEQMRIMDIPIFFNKTNTKLIHDKIGNSFDGLLKYKSFDYLYKSIKDLNQKEIQKQNEVIDIYYPDFQYAKQDELKSLTTNLDEQESGITDSILCTIELIADEIIKQSIDEENPQWLIPFNFEDDKWTLSLLEDDIYKGKSGVLLFFYYLQRYSNKDKYKIFYKKLVKNIDEQIYIDPNKLGLTSNLGYFYFLSLISEYGDDKIRFRKYIKTIINLLKEQKLEKEELSIDYINGVLPLINTLVRYYKLLNNIDCMTLAIQLGNKVSEKLFRSNKNLEYSFGHGSLGAIYTFGNLYQVTEIEKFKEIHLKLKKQYRSQRINNEITWCNGKLGEFMVDSTKTDEVLREFSLLDNDCLCHGNSGFIDVLLTKYTLTGNEELKNKAVELINKIISSNNKYEKYKLFDTNNFRDVSMFTGLSGIGYQFLRVLNSEEMPSVLTI
ncbi:type 2 lanthipeptide synthetase LanM [Bacillus subtilis]|nr:type 2 lanthipeptide synthetase LanM [Bacillus subtilis]WGD68928.1 type 2 lanthipeptide synthetase LanM [Bacillus subtilis]WGD74040.1 type 2 lanthipeptide synthetase LanM [Bacillus subtilis]WGD90033.1 type 2 lanthipeptide synthetase LanM [Bacillus subtilis]